MSRKHANLYCMHPVSMVGFDVRLPKFLSCTEKLVLLYIATNGESEYSVSRLTESLGSSRKAVHVALRHLTFLRLVIIVERSRGRRGGVYKVDLKKLEDKE